MRDGAYVWQRADGRWEARYVTGKDDKGKTTYASVYGHSREDAVQKRSDKLRCLMVDSDVAEKMMRSNRPTMNPEIQSDASRTRTQSKILDPLNEEQALLVEQVLLNHNSTTSLAFLLCLYMGLSVAEVCAVRYSDFHDGKLRVDHKMLDTKPLTGQMISIPMRNIPIPRCVAALLMQNAFAESDKFILTGASETVAKPLHAINMFRKISRHANLPSIHPDALRSTFIRRACEAAINLETLAALTGMEAALIKRRFSGYFKTDLLKINQIYSTFKPLAKNNREMNLLILGAGSHGHTVKEIAEKLGVFQNISFLDDHAPGKNVLATCDRYKEYISEYPCAFVAIGDNEIRRTYMQKLKSAGFLIPRIIDPDASISPSAMIGEGTVLMAQSTVNANAIVGSGCILATGSIVDYGSQIGDYVHLDSAAMVTRDAKVESMVTVDSGEIVRNKQVI